MASYYDDNDGMGDRPDDAPDFEYPDRSAYEPDYSAMSDDQLEEARQNFPNRKALEEDILPKDYKPPTFGSRFRDEFNRQEQTQKALGEREEAETAIRAVATTSADRNALPPGKRNSLINGLIGSKIWTANAPRRNWTPKTNKTVGLGVTRKAPSAAFSALF